LARAIRAIEAAENAAEPAHPALLKRIIEVIDMQDSLESMKKYFSDTAWARQKPRYEQGPSPAWQALYREAGALLHEDPAGEKALARRWVELSDTDPGVLIGKARGISRRRSRRAAGRELP